MRLPKAAPQSCCRKLLPKVTFTKVLHKPEIFQAAVQSCSAKLLPKAASQSCSPALLHKIVPKAVLQSCCPKAAESCSPKLLPKIAPQSCVLIATPQRCSHQSGGSSKLPCKAAPQSCSLKRLPKAVPLRCSTKLCPKLFSKAVARNLRLGKPVYQHVSPKPFCTAAPDSCAPKLLSLPPTVVSESGF